MQSNMNDELDAILNDVQDPRKPQIKFQVDKMVNLLEELKVTFDLKMKDFDNPIKYKTDYSICRLPQLKTANEKLILNYLTSVEYASTAGIISALGVNRMTTGRSLRRLVELQYVIKVRQGQWKVNDLKIF